MCWPVPASCLAGWPSVLFFVAWVTVGKWVILVSGSRGDDMAWQR